MARVIWEKLVKKQILYGEGGSVLLPSLFAILEQAAKRSRQRPHRKGKSVTVHRGMIKLLTVFIADNGEQNVITLTFTNDPDGSLLIRKVCSVNPSVTLQDAEFKVLYADGSVVGESNGIYRTDVNGEILITGLKPGKSVVVTETRAPDGFILDQQSQTIQIKAGQIMSLTFKNQPNGSVKLVYKSL